MTNDYASEIIGRDYQKRKTTSYNNGQSGGDRLYQDEEKHNNSYGVSTTEMLEYQVLPVEFTRLAKGGWEYNRVVEGLVYQGGRVWQASGKSFLKVSFWQG